MTTNVDVEFIKDLEQCLKAADKLSDLDTEEGRLFVSQQLQDLHKFLQKKQKDAEARVDEEIKKEENEIILLKDRIDRATKSDGADQNDIAYTDIGVLWTVLKDEFWQLAFNAFISETNDNVKTILDNLIAILKVSFTHCKATSAKSRADMMFQVYYPGENSQQNKNIRLPKVVDPDLESICKTCQKNSTPFCLPSVLQAVKKDVMADRSVAKQFKYDSKMLSTAIEKYLEKCVEFCWIACLGEPEVRLITTPVKECKNISREFIGLDRTTHQSRPTFAYVEWPAIVRGDKIQIQWHLYAANQPRPKPKDIRGDPSQDYRVTRVEDNDGRLHEDFEDDTVLYEQLTPTEKASVRRDKVESKIDKDVPGNQRRQAGINGEQKDGTKEADNIPSEKDVHVDTTQAHGTKKGYKVVSKNKGHENLEF